MEKKISFKYILGLINNGYKKVWVNEWVKNFKKGRIKGRIHCFLRGDYIFIHFDYFKGWHHKVGYCKYLDEEIKKIKTDCE